MFSVCGCVYPLSRLLRQRPASWLIVVGGKIPPWSNDFPWCEDAGFGVPRRPKVATGTCPRRISQLQAIGAGQHQTLCVDGSPAGTAGGGGQVLPRGMVGPPCAPTHSQAHHAPQGCSHAWQSDVISFMYCLPAHKPGAAVRRQASTSSSPQTRPINESARGTGTPGGCAEMRDT